MVRQILCRQCGAFNGRIQLRRKTNARLGDKELDRYQRRRVYLSLFGSACCDTCNERLAPGDICFAVTFWRGGPKDQPRYWEDAFGTVLPVDAVLLADALCQ